MKSMEFTDSKMQLETLIIQTQSVIASVLASTEMPEERKTIYLNYEQPRLAEFWKQLNELKANYYGSYYGQTGWGVVVGENFSE